MDSIRKILEAVAKEHPYKIPSRRETYDKYNEGWTDAVNRIESMLPTNVGDTISRQAAIDALADYIRNVDKVYSTGKLSADDCRDAAKSVLDDLPSAQPEQRWIPCSEMLPEEGQEVLLQYKHKVIERDFFTVTWRSDYNYWHDLGRDIFAIAWMPLPEPYKEGENDE